MSYYLQASHFKGFKLLDICLLLHKIKVPKWHFSWYSENIFYDDNVQDNM